MTTSRIFIASIFFTVSSDMVLLADDVMKLKSHREDLHHLRYPRQTTHGHANTHGHLTTADSIVEGRSVPPIGTEPNLWLYRFPPWFLPNNPPPEGFKSEHPDLGLTLTTPARVETPPVEDGDVIIVSDFGDGLRKGHLQNVKVPGNSAYQDQIVQTILDLQMHQNQNPSYNSLQTTTDGVSAAGIATPWHLPHTAPEPPPPFPGPTTALTLQDLQGRNPVLSNSLVTKNPQENKFHVETTPQSGGSSTSFNGKNFPISQFRVTKDDAPNTFKNNFRPSPPDLSHNIKPPSSTDHKFFSPVTSGVFQPSPLLSVRGGKLDSSSKPLAPVPIHPPLPIENHGGLRNQTQFYGPPQPNSRPTPPPITNNIITQNPFTQQTQNKFPQQQKDTVFSNFFKDQQVALLEASDSPDGLNFQSGGDVGGPGNRGKSQGRPLWIPFIPGVPIPILIQHGLRASQKQSQGTRNQRKHSTGSIQNNHADSSQGNSFRLQHQNTENGSGSRPSHTQHPTSIQDIIQSDFDSAEFLFRKGRDNQFSLSKTAFGNPVDENTNRWVWQTS